MTPERMEAVETQLAALRQQHEELAAVVTESVATLRQTMDRVDTGDARDEEIRGVVRDLDTAVHKSYAGGPGIGPGLLANVAADEHRDRRLASLERGPARGTGDAPQDALTALWSAVLAGISAPIRAYSEARTATQAMLLIGLLAALLTTTEGGRDIIRGVLLLPARAIDAVEDVVSGTDVDTSDALQPSAPTPPTASDSLRR